MKKILTLVFCAFILTTKCVAQYNATDAATLISGLGSAGAGDTVYVIGQIDVTGNDSITIPAGVILQGDYSLVNNFGAGSQIMSDDLSNIANSVPGAPVFFVQTGAIIRNIQFKGPVSEFKNNTNYENFLNTSLVTIAPPKVGGSNCFRLVGTGVKITDCEFFGWDKWAIYAYNPGGHVIERCYFHRNKLQGYGYGIWVGGMGNTISYCAGGASSNFGLGTVDQGTTLIKNTIFQDNRHDIASNSTRHSYVADYCSFSQLSLSKNIDRHGSTVKTLAPRVVGGVTVWDTITVTGGDTTSLTNCRFYSKESVAQLMFPNLNCDVATGVANPGRIIFENNHFKSNTFCTGESYISISGICSDTMAAKYPTIVQIGGTNTFASSFPNTPKVKVCGVDATSGNAIVSDTTVFPAGGNSIYFKPDSSSDASGTMGSTRMRYIYHYNDQQSFFDNREVVNGNTTTHAYNNAGMYVVTMHGVDSLNYLGSDFAIKPFYIKPTDHKVHLIANVKDDHTWSGTTNVVLQWRVNNTVVWSDDVGGDEGWQRVDVDITSYLNLTTAVKDSIFFEMILTDTVLPMNVRGVTANIDDVYINSPTGNNMIKDGSFELYDDSWVLYWKRKSEVVASDGTSLPANQRVIITASSSDDTQKGGLWSGLISLGSLDKKMWDTTRVYHAGTRSKIYQVIKYPNVMPRVEGVEPVDARKVSIYPNPVLATGGFSVESSGFEEEKINLSIYDTKGAKKFEKEIRANAAQSIDCRLQAGTYFVYFKGDKKTEIKKLITVE